MRDLLALATVVAVGWSCVSERISPPQEPNIILIMADDLGYETLGVNGSTSYHTPNLDALANTGMRFTQVYATPLCTPSRVQLMTGVYNFRNYIGFGLLDPSARTFAHYLQAAGYRTAVVGKWQLYGNERQQELAGGRVGSVPEQAGFDEHAVWQVKERGSRYTDPHLDVTGKPSQDYPGSYGPDMFGDYIGDFLERSRDQPFLLYYPMVLTHDPFQPTPDHPDYIGSDPGNGVNDTTYFKSNVAYMDKVIGRIVHHLERLGLRENTLLLFTGDNGTDRDITSTMGDRVIRGLKGYTTEAGTRVPLIANWPGVIAPGQVNDNLIDFTDFLPTLLEAAHVETPDDLVTDGLSFYPQLVGQADSVRAWVFCDYAPNWGGFPARRFVHDRDWKLYGDGTFYHIATDPEEQHPIADQALTADILQLKQRFQTVLSRLRQ
ncbi:MAG: sulfatase-like hydrolase/transferase [Gemmatimonadota bacterium]|nr:MAG: sulfatase-like hydrolase/transferase [Gemmatimonadota bacterium]